MGGLKKSSDKGRKIMEKHNRYNLSLGELKEAHATLTDYSNPDRIWDALISVFYAGVDRGYKAHKAETGK